MEAFMFAQPALQTIATIHCQPQPPCPTHVRGLQDLNVGGGVGLPISIDRDAKEITEVFAGKTKDHKKTETAMMIVV
jgi:hypothetical protein